MNLRVNRKPACLYMRLLQFALNHSLCQCEEKIINSQGIIFSLAITDPLIILTWILQSNKKFDLCETLYKEVIVLKNSFEPHSFFKC